MKVKMRPDLQKRGGVQICDGAVHGTKLKLWNNKLRCEVIGTESYLVTKGLMLCPISTY